MRSFVCRNSLKLANEHHLKTVAFPAISTGVYGYPIQEAADVSVGITDQFKDSGKDSSKMLIKFKDSSKRAVRPTFQCRGWLREHCPMLAMHASAHLCVCAWACVLAWAHGCPAIWSVVTPVEVAQSHISDSRVFWVHTACTTVCSCIPFALLTKLHAT